MTAIHGWEQMMGFPCGYARCRTSARLREEWEGVAMRNSPRKNWKRVSRAPHRSSGFICLP
jgi:hypothetical protein